MAEIEKIIISRIKKLGEETGITPYLVGGYIRDGFLHRRNHDVDVVLEENALEFARKFSVRYRYPAPIFYGRFGTAMIEVGKTKLELATARKESYSQNSRKPDIVASTLLEDLSRRDFTINSIARNVLTNEIIDPFCGKKDLKDKIIKTPVAPDKTFFDDPLRILRGIRFATVLRFTISPDTIEAMKKNACRLSIVSSERISEEIMKIIDAPKPSSGFYLLDEIGVLGNILPEISALKEKRTDHPCKELFSHTMQTLDNISKRTKNRLFRVSTLFHDIGKPRTLNIENGKVSFHRHEFLGERMSRKLCEKLKISTVDAEIIAKIIRYHLRPHLLAKENPSDTALIRFIKEIGKERDGLFLLAKSDITSKNEKKVKAAVEKIENLEKRVKTLNKKMRLAKFKLAVNGFEIMKTLSIPEGKGVGAVKKIIEDMVLDGKLPNRKRMIIKHLKDYDKELAARANESNLGSVESAVHPEK